MFYLMNLSETFNNKHLDFKQITGNILKTRIYFVSHRPAFTAAYGRLEFFRGMDKTRMRMGGLADWRMADEGIKRG